MQTKLLWLAISAFAFACSSNNPDSLDPDGVGGDIGGGLGTGLGGTGGSPDTTLPACVGDGGLALWLKSNGIHLRDEGLREFEATLTSSTLDSAIFETCPDGGGEGGVGGAGASLDDGCLTLEIEARDLALPIRVGTTVGVKWNLANAGFQSPSPTMAVLRDLGDETIGGFLLGVGNGLAFPDSPISYTSSELDCAFNPPSNLCGSRIAYALTFTAVDKPSSSTTLTMGQTEQLELDPNSDRAWRVHNIRSAASGNCDALDPMQYYVVRDF